MKGGKVEDSKVMGPLFPRLHVNDANKGGPRAPPRNKMALYEQLSIPSQRYNHAGVPTLPLPPWNSGIAVPSASSSQGCGHDMSMFSQYYKQPHAPSACTENVQQHPSNGKSISSPKSFSERKSMKIITSRDEAVLGKSTAECSSFQLPDSSNARSLHRVDIEEDTDFRVPTFDSNEVALYSEKNQHMTDMSESSLKKTVTATKSPSRLPPKAHESPPKDSLITDLVSRANERSYGEQTYKETVLLEEHTEKTTAKEKRSESLNLQKVSSHQENSTVAEIGYKNSQNGIKRSFGESNRNGNLDARRCSFNTEVLQNEATLNPKIRLGSNTPHDKSLRNSGAIEDNRESMSRTQEQDDMEKNDDVSETSMVDSGPDFDISPDDVVGIIGPKHFWKARRAIVNQQRVFAVQVFELHRVIKVQKLIAASPQILFESKPHLSGTPKVSAKKPDSESTMKSQKQTVKQKDDSLKVNKNMDATEKTHGALPLQCPENCLSKGPTDHAEKQNVSCASHPVPIPPPSDNQLRPWCFPPNGNQWLIPVMSPSEGLVYKPCFGPYSPNTGFMAPVYGGVSPVPVPMPMPSATGDFTHAAYGYPVPHQQQNMGFFPGNPAAVPNYFPPPYCLPVMSQTLSSSAVVQPSLASQPNLHIDHTERQCHSLHNASNSQSEALSFHACRNLESNDNGLQGSSPSSPRETVRGGSNAMPFMFTASSVDDSNQPGNDDGGDHQTRVIKVVPHNARLATASAARIFRSIQKERQHYDCV